MDGDTKAIFQKRDVISKYSAESSSLVSVSGRPLMSANHLKNQHKPAKLSAYADSLTASVRYVSGRPPTSRTTGLRFEGSYGCRRRNLPAFLNATRREKNGEHCLPFLIFAKEKTAPGSWRRPRGPGKRECQTSGAAKSCHEHHEVTEGPSRPYVINPTELQRFLSGNRWSPEFVPCLFLDWEMARDATNPPSDARQQAPAQRPGLVRDCQHCGHQRAACGHPVLVVEPRIEAGVVSRGYTNAYNYEKQSPTSGRGIGRRVTKPKAKIPSALHLAKGYPILRLQHISCPG
jgi:hypothetical protein